jgi:hypothetical protein
MYTYIGDCVGLPAPPTLPFFLLPRLFFQKHERPLGLEWARVQAKLEVNVKNCGHSMK